MVGFFVFVMFFIISLVSFAVGISADEYNRRQGNATMQILFGLLGMAFTGFILAGMASTPVSP